MRDEGLDPFRASWTGSSPWAQPGWRRRAARIRRPRDRRRRSGRRHRRRSSEPSRTRRDGALARGSHVSRPSSSPRRCFDASRSSRPRSGAEPPGEAVPPLSRIPIRRWRGRRGRMRARWRRRPRRAAIVQGVAGVLLSPPSTGRAGISLTDADAATSAARTPGRVRETWRDVCESVNHISRADAPAREVGDDRSVQVRGCGASHDVQPARGGSRRGGGDAPRGGEALGGAATRERHERRRRRRLALPCSPPVGAVDVFDRRVARRGHGPERPRRRGRFGRVGPPRRPGPLRRGGCGCRGGGRRGSAR